MAQRKKGKTNGSRKEMMCYNACFVLPAVGGDTDVGNA